MVPSLAVFCSLTTTLNLSPIPFVPLKVRLAAGLAATALVVFGLPSASTAVTTTPLLTVVAPLAPDLEARAVVLTESAVKGPAATFLTDAELVTVDVPFVLTDIGPDRGMAFPPAGDLPPKTTA